MMNSQLPDFELETYVPYQMTVLAARLSDHLAKHYESKFGITIAEWRVLLNVGYSKQSSIRDIERRVSLGKSKVSRAASRLESKGYITKVTDEDDRRLLRLSLSKDGEQLLQELIPIANAFQSELKEVLSEHFDGLEAALAVLMREME